MSTGIFEGEPNRAVSPLFRLIGGADGPPEGPRVQRSEFPGIAVKLQAPPTTSLSTSFFTRSLPPH